MLQIQTLPVACASKSPRRCSASGAGDAYLYLTTFGRREQEAKINKNEREFCGEMEMGMEKTMEQIENILERATLDQLKIILRFLRNIIK